MADTTTTNAIWFMHAAFLSVYKAGGALFAVYAVGLIVAKHLRMLPERIGNRTSKNTS